MNLYRWKLFGALLLSGAIVGATVIVFGEENASMSRVGTTLSTETDTIRVGQPLVCTLTYTYESDSNAPPNEVLHNARVDISDSKGEIIVNRYAVWPSLVFRGRKNKLLVYSGNFSLFWNFRTKEGLIFDKPGRYEVKLTYKANPDSVASKPLNVTVEAASQSDMKALALLSSPYDHAFLELGEHGYPEQRPERMAHLSRVADKYPDSFLGKWCAGRLGLAYFEDFHRKHPSFEKFRAKYRDGEIKEPLFERASDYLSIGVDLPDNFALREDVLLSLSRIEFIKGDFEKAASLLDELGAKFPHGRYGKKATQGKAELLRLQEREPRSVAKPPGTRQWTRSSVIVATVIGVALFAGLLFVLARKKGQNLSI